jgi:hypothetical protein
MEISGAPHEGWMIFVPLSVLVLIIVYVLGGPVAFVNTLSNWVVDILNGGLQWLRHL